MSSSGAVGSVGTSSDFVNDSDKLPSCSVQAVGDFLKFCRKFSVFYFERGSSFHCVYLHIGYQMSVACVEGLGGNWMGI